MPMRYGNQEQDTKIYTRKPGSEWTLLSPANLADVGWANYSYLDHIKPLAVRVGHEWQHKFACPVCNHRCCDQKAFLNHVGTTGKVWHPDPGVQDEWITMGDMGEFLFGPVVADEVDGEHCEWASIWVPTASLSELCFDDAERVD